MTPERCAEITVDAAARRRAQQVMSVPGKVLVTVYGWLPGLLNPQLSRIGNLYRHK